ncbi:MAG: ABC-F family ATP-binding cassette domain-containing protein [Candidatus Omnitrophota bacterium]|nr:ABC-F family ATP-binding cassette domain-containing protein [Candidatus Omnitrophota bacterium]
MISLTNLSKNYDKRLLLDKVFLTINRGEKIGLIGPNGSGKTMLFSIILGEVEPSNGKVEIHKNIHIGYLPQEYHFSSTQTVIEELTEGDERIRKLKKEQKELEDKNETATARYADILHNLEVLGVFELEYKAKRILAGLGFKQMDFNRAINNLSGGWQMRTLLAKLLTYNYDLLLLDEPTNYLDLNAALWLKDYLAKFEGTLVMISHDKVFLNEVTNYTLILEQGKLNKIRGNYEQYERIKGEKKSSLERQFKEQEKRRKQLEAFAQRFHAQPNRAAAVRNKRKMLERMPVIELVEERRSIRDFEFPVTKRSGYRVISLEKISKSYGDIQVYQDLDFEIVQGEKAVLVGENGAGKSTLLKILAGVIPTDAGKRIVGHNVEALYFSQTRMDVLNPERSVLEEALSVAGYRLSVEKVRTLLGIFLFQGDDVEKKVSVLSGGEKSRLILAKLLINPPNFILLDEPTTHLDIDAVEALTTAFKSYEGTLVFISHDIFFTKTIASKVFEVKDGKVKKFSGNLDYYLERKDKEETKPQEKPIIEEKQPELKKSHHYKTKEQKRLEALHRQKESSKQNLILGKIQKQKQEIKELEKERKSLEVESFAKANVLTNIQVYKRKPETVKEYGQRLKAIRLRLTEIEKELEELKGSKA